MTVCASKRQLIPFLAVPLLDIQSRMYGEQFTGSTPSALVNLDRLTTMHESCQSNELLKSEESPWIYGIQLRRVDRMGRIRVVMWTLRPPVVARLRWSLDVEHQPAERLRKNLSKPAEVGIGCAAQG